MRLEIRQILRDLRLARASTTIQSKKVAQTLEQVKFAEENYRSGRATILDLTDSQDKKLNAEILLAGDIIDMRVRNISGNSNCTLVDAQLIIG